MKAVVERFRKDAERTYETGWKEGVALGTAWATKHSHISHLRRIGEEVIAFDKPDDDVTDWLHCFYCQSAG